MLMHYKDMSTRDILNFTEMLLREYMEHDDRRIFNRVDWFNHVVSSLNSLLSYFENYQESIIVDSLYGLRVAEGRNTANIDI